MKRLPLKLSASLVIILMATTLSEGTINVSVALTQEKVLPLQPTKVVEIEKVSVIGGKNLEIKEDVWYVEKLPLTKEQQKYVVELCKAYDFDPLLIYAVMKKESNFTIDCKSETSDLGIMQINSSNFKWLEEQLGRDLKFLTFEDNVLAGVYMLNHYRDAWKYSQGEDERKHMIYYLNSYNMGVKGFKKLVASRGGNYNREYSSDILEYYKQYMLGNFE